ncbi:GNAT family N-acetyltransferase [Streptomyces reniochalinae]|uniref:GNAT family N-acetyltransferase n=2 Tax=Streptomyces reniochalinae TaxID=2250578 RepID=A0A367F0I2_9ACTN|nr:GNAT family N-acetyltransferase [Streptomyces reniochalinae]RCG23876.1 GNAT family N-acetyltransferase [Streptomyces reniochalinae]
MGVMSSDYVVREVRAEDWPSAKELRLDALRDPLAPLAFLETYDQARAQPDEFWRERTAKGSDGGPNRQFIAEGPAGDWAGTMTVLVEEPGTEDFTGQRVERCQAHLVGVFVREGRRGGTVARELLRAAVGWALVQQGVSRVRLFVHEKNSRAEAFYQKAGFTRTAVVGHEYEMEYRPTA